MTRDEAIKIITDELDRAEEIYPDWPSDVVHQAAIVAEEAGELLMASLNKTYHKHKFANLYMEAAQTGAMAIRFLVEFKP